MARRYNAQRVRMHLVYTVWDVAELLGCHRQTVIRWIKIKGLPADTGQRPWLIEGRDLKTFLGQMATARKRKLGRHEFYCLCCRDARRADGRIADYVQQTITTGMLQALCPACGSLMNRLVRYVDLNTIHAGIEVAFKEAVPRLVSPAATPVNVTFDTQEQTHAKAQPK